MTTARASALAFLTAAATLSLQVLVHRMVSAKLLNNYAFLVISLTMLGFALSGVILGSLLARPDLSARWVYSADLFGSALGALVVIPAISWVGVEWSALGAGFLLLAGTLLLARPGSRLAWAVAAGAAVVLLLAALRFDRVFDIYYPEGSILAAIRDPRSGVVLEHTAWDPLARVEVSGIPHLFRCLSRHLGIGPARARHRGRRGLRRPDRPLLRRSEVTAVEVNAATVGILTRTYRDYFRNWVEDPRVHLVQAEGRNFLESTDRRFDLIQLSGVDSASGTPGAAHVFSENYLYTQEAFDLYLNRLSDQGIMNMMRLEYIPAREMLRALTTAVEALRRAGVRRP